MEITSEAVARVIKKLKRKKASDREGWKNEMLLGGGAELQNQLKIMLNQIAKGEDIPEAWKKFRIKSIHKKRSKLKMDNRRGIFITNIISKV